MTYFNHKVFVDTNGWNDKWAKWCSYHYGPIRRQDYPDGEWSCYRDSSYDERKGRRYVFKFKFKSDAIMFREYGIDCIELDRRAREVAKVYFSGLPYIPTDGAKMMFKMAAM